MPLTSLPQDRPPDAWRIFGHSYFQHGFGVRYVNGRADSLLRAALDIEHPNWQNWSVTGAKLSPEGYSAGGYGRIYQALRPEAAGGAFASPYVQYGGGVLFNFGINDIGNYANDAQRRNAFQLAVRGIISVARASLYYDTNHSSFAYGGSWSTINAGGTREYTLTRVGMKRASTTTPTITFTLPSDFKSKAVTLFFVTNPGTAGGSITLSGTAGATGTTAIKDTSPSAELTHNTWPIRISGLSSANAGQTIIVTVSAIDAGGFIDFDGLCLESVNPGPVLITNVAKLTSTGYAGYSILSGNSVATNDAIIDTWSGLISTVVGEFDSMVQLVDIDGKLNGTAGGRAETMSSDGLHPNELGAALIADACLDAISRLVPDRGLGKTAQLNTPSLRWGTPLMPRISQNWYASENGGRGVDYTAVSGDMFALPILEQHPIAKWIDWAVELNASTAAASVMFGIYDDRGYYGYPQSLYTAPAGGPLGSALALSTGAGVKQSPASGNGALDQPIDPGLYWLVLKITAIGTGTIFRTLRGPNPYMPGLTTTGALVPAAASTSGGAMGYKLTGQGTGTLPTTFPTGGVITDNIPVIGLKYN